MAFYLTERDAKASNKGKICQSTQHNLDHSSHCHVLELAGIAQIIGTV